MLPLCMICCIYCRCNVFLCSFQFSFSCPLRPRIYFEFSLQTPCPFKIDCVEKKCLTFFISRCKTKQVKQQPECDSTLLSAVEWNKIQCFYLV